MDSYLTLLVCCQFVVGNSATDVYARPLYTINIEFVISIVIGAFIVLVGLLVKRFPDLIAGYNTMSSRKKANVDIKGLSSMMRTSLVVLGTIVGLIYPIMTFDVLQKAYLLNSKIKLLGVSKFL